MLLAGYRLHRWHSVNVVSISSQAVGQSQLFIGCLLHARHCCTCWGYSHKQNRGKSCPVGLTPSQPQALPGAPRPPWPSPPSYVACRCWVSHPRPDEVAPVAGDVWIFRITAVLSPLAPQLLGSRDRNTPVSSAPTHRGRPALAPSPLPPAPFSTPTPGCVSHPFLFIEFCPVLYLSPTPV